MSPHEDSDMEKKKTAPGNPSNKKLDWAEISRRVRKSQAALGESTARTPERNKEILKARAQALARDPQEEEIDGQYLDVVEFLLAYENYAIESSWVREVYPLKELTPLPGTPSAVLGVTNVRGEILSVIDLKKLFDLPERGLTDLNKVIVVRGGGTELGILADQILGLRSVPLKDIQSSLPALTGIREEYLRGVTSDRLVILDAKRILSAERHARPEGEG